VSAWGLVERDGERKGGGTIARVVGNVVVGYVAGFIGA
jgi:hypothetical protein